MEYYQNLWQKYLSAKGLGSLNQYPDPTIRESGKPSENSGQSQLESAILEELTRIDSQREVLMADGSSYGFQTTDSQADRQAKMEENDEE